jgi:sulfite exporter TauE/SafE
VTLTLFASMFAVGLATSVHCISMCGPMVVTYAVKGDEGDGWTKRVRANVAYQGAKLLSYMLVGLALGAIGSAFNLDGVRPWVMLAAGVFMSIIGLGMTGKVPWAARLTPRPPRALINAIGRLRRKASTDAAAGESTLATPIAFGLLTGLMPCAPLAAAEIAAASSGNVVTGGFIMVAFGLGTLPLLFAFGTASSLIPYKWKQRLTFVLAFVVIGLGLVFVNRTAMLMGFPVNSHTIQAAITGKPMVPMAATPASYTKGADGVVEVNLTVASGGYQPAALNIPANTPVRLIVNRVGSDACSKQLVFPNLGVKRDLADNGVTTIDLPATKTGTFTMTCGMGMLTGSLVVGGGAPGGGGMPSWAWLTVIIAAILGAFWLALGLGPRVAPAPQIALAMAGQAAESRHRPQTARTQAAASVTKTRSGARPAAAPSAAPPATTGAAKTTSTTRAKGAAQTTTSPRMVASKETIASPQASTKRKTARVTKARPATQPAAARTTAPPPTTSAAHTAVPPKPATAQTSSPPQATGEPQPSRTPKTTSGTTTRSRRKTTQMSRPIPRGDQE